MSLTNEEFIATIRKYLADNDLFGTQLAKKIERPEGTVADWIKKGIKRDQRRQQVVDSLPWLFSQNGDHVGEPEPEPIVAERIKIRSVPSEGKQLQTLVKIELARQNVTCLTEVLVWFVFSASREERDRFREDLGDAWQGFLELTRAMTGEKALEITQREGRLARWQHQ